MELTAKVKERAKQLFSGDDLNLVLGELEAMSLPLISNNGERVQLGILKISGGNLTKFERAVELAQVDWRDLLVVAGMSEEAV